MPVHRLVLMRHGESSANLDGTFAGWLDVPLTARGREQAAAAGRALHAARLAFDLCFTSVLQRATHSARHTLDAMDRSGLPVERSWRLNERHYGALQGLDKSHTAATYGKEQVRQWRRSFCGRPPALAPGDPRLAHDARYAQVPGDELPRSESMQDVVERLRPLWDQRLAPEIASGRRLLVVAHGTTLRALAVILGQMSSAEAESTEVPNAVPVLYELDAGLRARGAQLLSG